MKISYNWLKEYLNIDLDPKRVASILTATGLEVEDIYDFESIKGGLKGVVIGKVLECKKHPNADKLSLTKVDIGNGIPLSIVCGAPNVATGQKVLVATIGTILHQGEKSFEIKKTRIRGEASEGMICAEDELGLGNSHDGIMVLPDDTPIGKKASSYFKVEKDTIFEIGLTPNRTDATSHIGVARDLAAAVNHIEGRRNCKLNLPSVADFEIDNKDLDIDVIVEDLQACPRYSGLTLSGLKIEPSPDWLKNKLNAIGVRPINNIVDITNFVLFETGQPLHAFDAEEVAGNKVIVKKLPNKTPFVTLDEVERKLSADDLMICNAEEPMCIGGVFGGLKSGVTEKTTAIFLESACFNAKNIRRTSKNHGLQTDASFRFERGSDPDITVYALKRAAMLMKELAGGTISSDIKDVYPIPVKPYDVRLDLSYLTKLTGQPIPAEQVQNILNDLQIDTLGKDASGFDLQIPPFKTDVTRPADVVEEVLRIYGYDNINIPEKLNTSITTGEDQDAEKFQHIISEKLTANGFFEIMNNSLTRSLYSQKFDFLDDSHNVTIINPLSSDLNVMRQSLLFGGLESMAYNQNRKNFDLKFYEFGNVYRYDEGKINRSDTLAAYYEEKHLDLFIMGSRHSEIWNRNTDPVDFYDLKASINIVFKGLNINEDELSVSEIKQAPFEYGLAYEKGPDVLVTGGKLHRDLLNFFDLKKPVYYAHLKWDRLMKLIRGRTILFTPVAKFPAVRRDLALVIDKQITFGELRKAALEAVPNLLKSVMIFDVYEGEKIPDDKKSYAISFILQDQEKTLTDKVIDKTMDTIMKQFQVRFGATLR